ncbi:MAG: hypothetical protein H0V66_08155 [Bdellovibrionales bacterium]|nr:hypothetical protein [Bdellovibrionales bacterium]
MKTFLILFAIAVSLPADAQRVKENVRQRVEIVDVDQLEEAQVAPEKAAPAEKKKARPEKDDAERKQ